MSRYTGMFRLFPITNASEDGFVINDKDVIKQSILNIINTHKGSRVYDPDFGTNLYKLIHELNIQRTRNIAQSEITTAIGKYEPRAELISVNVYAGKDEKSNEIVVVVNFKYVEYNEIDELEIILLSEHDWISEEGVSLNPIEDWFNVN